jgi:predicted nucleotidyltransferase
MSTKSKTTEKLPQWYRGADIPMRVIRRYARQVAERFQPDKIILFGSYAYGTPHVDSDVDLLVVMQAWNQLSKAAEIQIACEPQFPLDIIVRTPDTLRRRLEERESFHTEIVTKGKVLYEERDSRVGAKCRSRLPGGAATRRRK